MKHHDKPSAGHPSVAKTLKLTMRQYTWFGMCKDVKQYLRNCHICYHYKSSQHAPYGTLKSLPLPDRLWKDITVDFVTGLPDCEGFNTIMMVADRLGKMRHIIPCNDTVDAKAMAQLYLRHVWKHHRFPKRIVCDRGTQFKADLWQALSGYLEIENNYSTAYHPQTDGQSERFNAVMEQNLRAYINYQQDNWVTYLPMVELVANNQFS